MKIVVVDYGLGNTKSIYNAFLKQGIVVEITRDADKISKADGLVLPGVGAFPKGMENINKYYLKKSLFDYVNSGRPFLGICLGMQLLFEKSNEFIDCKGLSLIPGIVEKLEGSCHSFKLPHVGWSDMKKNNVDWANTLFEGLEETNDVYFVHSYAAKPSYAEDILSRSYYTGKEFCAAVKRDNIYGCQFHPEKSGETGLKIIKNFINICEENNVK